MVDEEMERILEWAKARYGNTVIENYELAKMLYMKHVEGKRISEDERLESRRYRYLSEGTDGRTYRNIVISVEKVKETKSWLQCRKCGKGKRKCTCAEPYFEERKNIIYIVGDSTKTTKAVYMWKEGDEYYMEEGKFYIIAYKVYYDKFLKEEMIRIYAFSEIPKEKADAINYIYDLIKIAKGGKIMKEELESVAEKKINPDEVREILGLTEDGDGRWTI